MLKEGCVPVFVCSVQYSDSMAEQRPPRKARRQRIGHGECPQTELLSPEKCENEASVVQTLASPPSDILGPQNQTSVAETTSEHYKKSLAEQNAHLHAEPQPVSPHSQSNRKQRKRKKKKLNIAVETSSIQSSSHHQTISRTELRPHTDEPESLCESGMPGNLAQPQESDHEEVKSKLESVECQTFRTHFGQLLNAITDPDTLAANLYANSVISLDTLKEIKAEGIQTKAFTLLLAVQEQISSSPTTKFRDFVDVLYSDPSLQHLTYILDPRKAKSDNCTSIFDQSEVTSNTPRATDHQSGQYESGRDRYESGRGWYESGRGWYESGRSQYGESGRDQYRSRRGRYESGRGWYESGRGRYDESGRDLYDESGRGQYESGRGQYDESGRGQYDESGRGQYESGRGRYENKRGRYDESERGQYERGRSWYQSGRGRYDESGRGQYESGRGQYDESGRIQYESGRGQYDESGRGQYDKSGRDQYESGRGWYERGHSRRGWCDRSERGWYERDRYNESGRSSYERDQYNESGRSWYERDQYNESGRGLYERLFPHQNIMVTGMYPQTLATLHPSFPIEFGMRDETVPELVRVHQQRSKRQRQVSTGKIDSRHSSSLNEATTKDDSHGDNSECTPYSLAYPSLMLPEFQSGSSESTTSSPPSTPSSSAAECHDTTRLTERDHSTLCNYLNKHAAHWRRIGQNLGFLPGELDNIQHTPTLIVGGPVAYLSEMLATWLQWAPGDGRGSEDFATLEALKYALNKASFGVTATDLTRLGVLLALVSNSSQASISSKNNSEHQQQVVANYLYQSHAGITWRPRESVNVQLQNLYAYNEYANYLREYYTQNRPLDDKWPHLGVRKFIRLAVVSNEFESRKDLNQFRESTIHGSIDNILEKKAPLELHEIFDHKILEGGKDLNLNQFSESTIHGSIDDILEKKASLEINDHEIVEGRNKIKKVLIEGAPGIGKSTMSCEICERWGRGELFTYFSMVLLLKFRDKWVQDAKCLSDLFGVHYRDRELQQSITREVEYSHGSGLLLILEGYDEAPASLQNSQSVFLKLFAGRLLPNATVVITTRPSASSELRFMYNSRRIEVLGFGVNEINEYIHSSFTEHVELLPDFKQYLDLYPHIHSMMYVPLNSAVVTRVYQDCKSISSIVPKTMTQLYSSLVKTLLLRYLKEQPEYKRVKNLIHKFTDLPKPVYEQFLRLCEIAYLGIMKAQTELIFSDLPSDFNTLGLMQSCPELYIDKGESYSYNFLHLTIQEFLAAYHISLFDEDKLEKDIEKLIEKPVVMKFLAALCPSKAIFWEAITKFKPALHGGLVSLYILHLLFETQNLSAYAILGSDKVHFRTDSSMKPFDCYVLGSCIASSASTCTWEIDFSECAQIDFKVFSKGLIARTINVKQTIILKYITNSGLCSFSRALESTLDLTLDCLKITNVKNDQETQDLVKGSKFVTIPQLEDVKDSEFDLDLHQNPAYWVMLILTSCTLKCLEIAHSRIDVNHLAKAMEANSTLKSLKLSHSTVENEGVVCFVKSLETNTTLECLGLIDCAIHCQNEEGILLAKALEKNSTLQQLDLSNNTIQSEGAIHLAKALETNSTLEHLDLSNNAIQSEGVVHLSKALLINSTLNHLDLRKNRICDKGAICLAEALETHSASTLDYLDLSNNEIQNEGVIHLAKALETNSTLKYFGIRCVSIDDLACQSIAVMLRCNRSLETLDLSDNSDCTELGILNLIISLSMNTTLKTLHLSPEYYHYDGARVKCY